MSYCLTTQTPVGLIAIHGGLSITRITWAARPAINDTAELRKGRDQVTAYFAGTLRRFDLCLKPSGTKFQQAVWNRVLLIPYGTTSTYGEVAKKLRTSARAVGRACATNPIPLLIPCHRVLSKNGSLTGYSGGGGLQTKEYLLTFEQNSTVHSS